MLRRLLVLLLIAGAAGVASSHPAEAQAPMLARIVLVPDKAGPDDHIQGLVTLTGPAPAGGAYVQLSTSGSLWIPGTVVVPAGQTSATFVVVVNRSAQDSQAVVVGTLSRQSVASNQLTAQADPALAPQDQASQRAPNLSATPQNGYPYAWWYGAPYPAPYPGYPSPPYYYPPYNPCPGRPGGCPPVPLNPSVSRPPTGQGFDVWGPRPGQPPSMWDWRPGVR